MIGNQNNQVPHLTQDSTWESDNNTSKPHVQASQEVSPFPAGDHRTAMHRHESKTNTNHKKQKMIHKRSTAFEWSVKYIFTGELKQV